MLPIETVWAVDIHSMNNVTRYKTLSKRQLICTHPNFKLISLLKYANAWSNEFHADTENIISKNCLIFKSFAKTPLRLLINFPLPHNFNQNVAIDPKSGVLNGLLHLVDMWSQLTISVFIDQKTPLSIINVIMLN